MQYFPWIAGAVLLIAGFAFWLSRTPAKGEDQAAVCVLVVDRTGSSNDQLTVDRYHELATKSVDGCRMLRARMSVYFFDQASQKLVLVNDTAFELWQPKGRKQAAQERKVEKTVEEAKQAVVSVFDRPPGGDRGSDILTAMNEAAKNLKNQASADSVEQRFLIMLSDGIQLSSDITVEAFTDDSVPVQPLLDRAEQINLIPTALDGAEVSFVGVRSGEADQGDQLPQWFEGKIEQFWQGIVAAGGGKMCTYVVDSQVLPVNC
jgi:hypothetical protein